MKKIIALALCLMMLTVAAAAAAETAEKAELGKLNVNGAFTIQYGALPEGYTLEVMGEDEFGINARIQAEDKAGIILSIFFEDMYTDVERLNDLTEEQMDYLKSTYTAEFDNVEFDIRETAYGTKLLVVTMPFDDGSIIGDVFTIYKGYDIELMIVPKDGKPVTEEDLKTVVDFLSDMDFVPAE